MTYGLWLSAGGLQINEYRQSLLANNLANSSTTGFKHDLAVIHERAVESRDEPGGQRFAHGVLDHLTGGSWVRPTVHTFEKGDFERTDNPLDVAIDGTGFLSVSDGTETRYTRDGSMTLNRNGELVMSAGQGRWRVLDEGGAPILLDPAGGEIEIGGDGTVHQGGESVGRLGVVDFDDTEQLSKVGANLYVNHGAAMRPAESAIRSRYLEMSTVSPVKALAEMIEASRAYQVNANLISLQDQTIGQAVTTVGRIG